MLMYLCFMMIYYVCKYVGILHLHIMHYFSVKMDKIDFTNIFVGYLMKFQDLINTSEIFSYYITVIKCEV